MKKLKDGWESIRLGDIAITVTSGSRDWAQYYSDTGAKFIRMTNLNRNGITLLLDDLKFVNVQSNSADGKRTSLQANDILISITAELGKIGFIPENFGEAYINQHTALVRIDPNKAHAKFIAYVLSSVAMNKTINSLNDAGAKAGLNLPTIKVLSLKLPSIEKQIQIAEMLSTWDNAIQTTEKLLENSRRQKKALMQRLLSGENRKEVKLIDIGKVITGNTPPKSDSCNYGNEICWATADDFNNKYIRNTKIKLSKIGANKARIVPKGSILVTCIASIGKNAIADIDLATNQQINSIIVNSNMNNEFIYYLIENNKHKLFSLAGTTAVPIVNKTTFEKMKFMVPALNEQQKIAEILSTADQEIEALQRKLECLKLEKGALMQRLL